MKIEEKRPMSFRTLIMAVSACIALLVAVLIALNYAPNAFAGDATSFNPTSVAVQARAASDYPIGAVAAYRGDTPPVGWLECNGQSTTGYPELAAVVGANVPDLRGEFIRGLDSGRGVDAGRALGSAQADAMERHSHQTTITVSGRTSVTASPYHSAGAARSLVTTPNFGSPFGGASFSASGTGTSTSVGSGAETRPRNVALMYIIKAQ
ncbi:tail fiber protein [Maridesulfovibrio salexigens]|uniref:Tail Collar domain protein n=1 Tax=Maridesulfovibrio salexigens (strain ATCC 14822 / DSM 2638 / NCIMB 8403 / VKM B-1763) TaxID=526222 RepID=C6BT48_MARSD|nr:tail fiber protein [Maridesulfovibrio salexigens]ACS79752.1 Tail Collar domain protein [Maridesulfovibrio salexigens DSM 2638]